jgi:hypothetical protein
MALFEMFIHMCTYAVNFKLLILVLIPLNKTPLVRHSINMHPVTNEALALALERSLQSHFL